MSCFCRLPADQSFYFLFSFKEKEEKRFVNVVATESAFRGVAQGEVGKVRRQSMKGLGT